MNRWSGYFLVLITPTGPNRIHYLPTGSFFFFITTITYQTHMCFLLRSTSGVKTDPEENGVSAPYVTE